MLDTWYNVRSGLTGDKANKAGSRAKLHIMEVRRYTTVHAKFHIRRAKTKRNKMEFRSPSQACGRRLGCISPLVPWCYGQRAGPAETSKQYDGRA